MAVSFWEEVQSKEADSSVRGRRAAGGGNKSSQKLWRSIAVTAPRWGTLRGERGRRGAVNIWPGFCVVCCVFYIKAWIATVFPLIPEVLDGVTVGVCAGQSGSSTTNWGKQSFQKCPHTCVHIVYINHSLQRVSMSTDSKTLHDSVYYCTDSLPLWLLFIYFWCY